MAGEILYLDSSALVKLVVDEPESAALQDFISNHTYLLSSALSVVEVTRAVFRSVDEPAIRLRLAGVLGEVSLALVDANTLLTASRIHPMTLRSLDSIHLATAFLLGKDLAGFVTYDRRLYTAANLVGCVALKPGAE